MGIGVCKVTTECLCQDLFNVGLKFEVVSLEVYLGNKWKKLDSKKDFTVKMAGWDWERGVLLFHVDHPDIPETALGQLTQPPPEVTVVFQRLL